MRNPNGYGSIVNLGKGRRMPFAVRVTAGWKDDGKQIYKYISYHKTKKDAMIALANYNSNPYDLEQMQITVKQLYNMWIEKKKNSEIKVKSLSSYDIAFKHCEAIENIPFLEIRATHIQEIIDNTPTGYPTKKLIKSMFNQLYDFARFKNLNVKEKYSDLVQLTNSHRSRAKIPFTEEEIQILWQNIDKKEFMYIALILIYTGLRISELLDIKIENVHIEQNYMRGGMKTKAGIDRIIPIHHRIKPIIEKLLEENRDKKYLIINSVGRQFKYFNFKEKYWDRWMRDLEMQHTPHETRHTTTTLLKKYGADELYKKRIIGHATKDLTDDVYTHIYIEQLISTIELIP